MTKDNDVMEMVRDHATNVATVSIVGITLRVMQPHAEREVYDVHRLAKITP